MKKAINEIMNKEFLMTNGLGGYTFSSIDGINCRKYHSMYTVSLSPPVQRTHMISKIVPQIKIGGHTHTWLHENSAKNPCTETFLASFVHKGTIEQSYTQEGVFMKVEHAMVYGGNELGIIYSIDMPEAGTLLLTPYYNFRDHHDTLTPQIETYRNAFDEKTGILKVSSGPYEVFVKSNGKFASDVHYSEPSYYPIETQRGYPDQERHVIMGSLSFPLSKGMNKIELMVNTVPKFTDAKEILSQRKKRMADLIDQAGFQDPRINQLIQASDDFIVYRENTRKKTIIAGYPWFTDWGRDTMIALPGLTLCTKRYDEALEMIEGFISKQYKGIIPNNFPDEGEAPMYNTSDGTLWLFNAIYQYYCATKNKEAIQKLYPEMMTIIKHHIEGTINDIFMDEDGLLSTGNEKTQLTWMDVKVNGWVVTPRHGKAVEINALWYNAICVTNYLAKEMNEPMTLPLEELAKKIKTSFNQLFWYEKNQMLYDLIVDGKPEATPRPNMIFAVSLPFEVLDEDKWAPVVTYVMKHFKVPYGLLTLRGDDPDFHGRYEGNLLSRDGAYHRGTAWGWLLGPYFEAHFKTFKDKSYIRTELETFFNHLNEGILGSASEIFEGDPPYAQRGCSAQAWSVAEIIRIWDVLELDKNSA